MKVRRSKLTEEQTRRLLEHFVAGTPARTAAELVHVNRNTATLFYHKMRELIAQHLPAEEPVEAEEAPPVEAAPAGEAGLEYEGVQRRAHLAHTRAPVGNTENFRNQAKRHLRRYNGVPRQHFHLFLKECEWRFNYGPPKQLMRILKSWIRTPPPKT
jgi:transposase